jgi:hypothetical protein
MVEHQNFPASRRFEPQVLKPICKPIQSVGKKNPNIYKLELSENLKVHLIFHVLLLKLIAHDASRPNQKYNSRLPFDLIDNEPEFKMEIVLKSR